MSFWTIQFPVTTSHSFQRVIPAEILAEFDGPLTFTFRDERASLFLAHLCAVDPGMSRYLVTATNDRIIRELKNGMISIRSAILHFQPLWLVDVSADGKAAKVWQASLGELPSGAVPDADVLLTDALEQAQLADEKLATFAKSGSDGQIAFDGGPVEKHKIEANFFGTFLQRANDLFAEVARGIGLDRSPRLRLGMTSESSYAVELSVAGPDAQSMIFGEEPSDAGKMRQAFDDLMSMIADKTPNTEAVRLIKLSPSVRQKYGLVLETVTHGAATIAVRTRSSPSLRTLTLQDTGEKLRAVQNLGYPYRHLEVVGRLIGGLVEKFGRTDSSFTIRVHGDKPNDFDGSVVPDAVPKMMEMKLGDKVFAKLRIEENKGNQVYTLIDISLAPADLEESIK